jgi:hypothetical protein
LALVGLSCCAAIASAPSPQPPGKPFYLVVVTVIAERMLALISALLVAAAFANVGHRDWAAVIVVAGGIATPLLLRNPASVPITPLQLAWLAVTSLIAVQFASTGVGPLSGFIVWLIGYYAWVLYRLGERNRERRAALSDLTTMTPVLPAHWPVIVNYPVGRTWAFRIASSFFGLVFLLSLWLLAIDLSRSTTGLGLVLVLWHLAVLWVLLAAGSRAAERVALYLDRVEMKRLVGGLHVVPWSEVTEVHMLRWSPQGTRTPQLQFVNPSGHVLMSLDLGDARLRSLVPLIRGRLGLISWRSERRTNWI